MFMPFLTCNLLCSTANSVFIVTSSLGRLPTKVKEGYPRFPTKSVGFYIRIFLILDGLPSLQVRSPIYPINLVDSSLENNHTVKKM